MRTDAKIGVMCALIITLVAGGYFMLRSSDEEPISLGVARSEDASDRPATRPRPAITKKSPTDADWSGTLGQRQANRERPAQSSKIERERVGSASQRIVGRDQRKTDRTPGGDSSSSASMPLTGLTGGWSAPATPSELPARIPADAGRSSKTNLVGVTTPTGSDPDGSDPAGSDPGRASRVRRNAARDSFVSSPSGRRPSAGVRNETHTVQDGDTFSSISKQYYGNERHIQALIQANPQIQNPDVLKIGVLLQIPQAGDAAVGRDPARSERRTSSATPSAARTYVVQPGDSFYKIAGDELGDPLRWQELFELNRATVGDDPSNLAVGAVLVLPAK